MSGIRKYVLLGAAAFALAGLFALPSAGGDAFAREEEEGMAASVGDEEFSSLEEALPHWTQGTVLKLLSDVETSTIAVAEEKSLDLNGHTLSLKEGETGSVLTVTGSGVFTLSDGGTGGTVTGGSAGEDGGGGVFVGAEGTLNLTGGTVTGNRARECGGGICALGAVTLSGDAVVADNFDGSGNASDLFLSRGNRVNVSGFSGRAGIKLRDPEEYLTKDFASGDGTGEFFSDDKEYIAEGFRLAVAPLASITVTYEGTGKVFPTTEVSALKEALKVEGTNVNGVPYTRGIDFTVPLQTLTVGENRVTVTAHGTGDLSGTEVSAEFTVEAVAPRLLSFEVLPPETPQTVYFDTPVEEVRFRVQGTYEDGHPRAIYATAEETAKNSDPYIADYYAAAGKLSERTDGFAEITVTVGQLVRTYRVEVSRYRLDAGDFSVRDVTVVDREGAWEIPPEAFVQGLPEGIEAVPAIGGKQFAGSELGPGVYTVELSFLVEDVENYEVSGTRTATLTINRERFSVTNDADEIVCSFSAEEGIPPDWEFTVTEIPDIRHPALEGDFVILQAVSFTLLREDGERADKLGVRLLLSPEARGKEELILYRMRADGSAEEVEFTRDGDYILFEGSGLIEAQYVIAADSGFGLYLALGITFGVLCALAAGGFLCYLVFKRRVRLK